MINQKWAYKFTGGLATGQDFEWYDSVYAGNQPPVVWTDPNKPPPGTTPFFGPPVSVKERIPDFNFRRYRGEANLYYSPTANSDIIVSAGGSNFNRLQLTTTGHNKLTDMKYGFVQARYIRPGFFANIYQSWSDLGSILNIYNYTRDYWNTTHDSRKPISPDSAEMGALMRNTVSEKSGRLNGELQYNHFFKKWGMHLVAGASMQLDNPNSAGLTLIDSFQRIQVFQTGSVVQLDKTLPWKMRLVGTVRVDYHNYLGTYTTPRFALLKNWEHSQLRVTWGKALAMPSIQQQFAAINRTLFGNGGGIRYIPSNASIYDTAQTIRLKPEIVSTWEIGYKTTLNNRLHIDASAYYGTSINFISPARVVPGRITSVDGVNVYPLNPGSIVRDTLKGGSFLTFFNYGTFRPMDLTWAWIIAFSKHVSSSLRYSWIGSDITEDKPENDANKDGYTSLEERSLNAPRHRGAFILLLDDMFKSKWKFSFSTRFVEKYDFYSGNQIGTEAGQGSRGLVYGGLVKTGSTSQERWYAKNFDWGPLGGFTTVDLGAGYMASKLLMFNLNVTNLFQYPANGSSGLAIYW
jgi:iron complex outermembrane receptor protein